MPSKGGFSMDVDVKTSGPVFNKSNVAKMQTAIEDEVGDEAVKKIKLRLDKVLKNPTGYYKSNIVATRSDYVRVHDSGVVYGPWLEGVSSRNESSTFKGYHTFRVVFQEIDKQVPSIASRIIHKYLD
jgi:hypothetical protein